MTWFMNDIEGDGPAPGLNSMVSFGCVIVEPGLSRSFYGRVRPISDDWDPEALKVSGHTREEHLAFPDPEEEMKRFDAWVRENTKGRAMYISDNNGYDWMWTNYYLHRYVGKNVFGYSSTNLGSLYKGLVKNTRKNFKHLRKTKHTHHPVDDAKGNAEALLHMHSEMGLKIRFD